MKKLGLIIATITFFSLTPTTTIATCYPLNEWTGLCDVGGECPTKPGICCENVQTECTSVNPNDYNYSTHDTTGTGSGPQTGATAQQANIGDLCKFAGNKSGECMSCFGSGEAWTAIGCIPTSPSGFMERFLSLGIGLAGGIAFLLIIFSGFQMLTSVGNPEKLNAGKELLTSAISGLILIIFSIFLLRLIGVDILGLPEFK